MGWSCRKEAGETLDAISQACIASTGSQNTWTAGPRRYFFEVDSKEHDDGAISGEIVCCISETLCRPVGRFRIAGDGRLTRGPRFFKVATGGAR